MKNWFSITILFFLLNNIFGEESKQFSESNINPSSTNDEFGDIVLKIGKHKVHCHKFVLMMSSTFFRAMFSNNMMEKDMQEISLQDINLRTLKWLLNYMYGKEVPSKELTPELLAAANVYEIPLLEKLCIEELLHTLEWDNVVKIWRTAYLHNVEELASTAVAFMAKNWNMLAEDKEVQKLIQAYPNLLLLVSKLLSENEFRTFKTFDEEQKITKIE